MMATLFGFLVLLALAMVGCGGGGPIGPSNLDTPRDVRTPPPITQPPPQPAQPSLQQIRAQAVGCFLQGAAASASNLATLAAAGQIYFPSNNLRVDSFNQTEGLNLVNTFLVSPRMFYLVDQPPNAYATPEIANALGPDGTILFGQNLLAQQLSHDPSGASVIAIMAHEFGHLIQFKNGFREPGKRPELHADFMAGWYLNLRGRYSWVNLMPVLRVFYQIGDFQFNSPSHHGTPDERLAAAQAGFNSRAAGVSQAYAAGWQFVK
jgi:hypothetical protein